MTVIIGIILVIFLSLILIGKKGKSLPDRILLVWLITIAINLILFNFQTEKARYNYPFFLGWGFPFPLLHWPFLYVYVLTLTSNKPLNAKLLLHFLPFLLSIILFSKYLFLPSEIKIDIYNRQGEGYETEMTINLVAIILSAIIYTILSSHQLWKHKQNIKNEFSFTEKITLNWLLYLIIGMSGILFVVIFVGNDEYIFSSITCIIIYIGYFGIKQMGIFGENFQMEQGLGSLNYLKSNIPLAVKAENYSNTHETDVIPEMAPTTVKVKYEKTKISEDEVIMIHQKLKELMNKEKLYKNPELTLSEVAKRIPTHPNALSQVINTIEQKNFYEYINAQRVEEFQQIVVLPKSIQFTLLSLSFESGFNSKTSFNRNFKKATNLTPSEFLKQKNIQLQD